MDELENLAETLLTACRAKKLLLASAESCTGGMLGMVITSIPGSSDVYERGVVSYSDAAKTELLGVPVDLINRYGAVSDEVASAMARGMLEASAANVAISITGIAGPGGSEFKPEGLVWMGLAAEGRLSTRQCSFVPFGRRSVRIAATKAALDWLLEFAQG